MAKCLVLEDMLGLSSSVPRFVKKYAELGNAIEEAVKDYASEVRALEFPGPDHVYAMSKREEPRTQVTKMSKTKAS